MPNKRKCKGCSDFYLPSIGEDGKVNQPPWVKWCSDDCREIVALEILRVQREKAKAAIKRKAKKKKQAESKQKRDFYDNDIKTREKAAKKACHLYIRTRDKDERCICCDRPLGKNFDAGHFLESGNYSHLRYDERNIHAQSVYCNQYKGGNSDDYEGRLRIKIGDAAVDEMKASKSKVTKRTVQDYKDIEKYYKQKLKDLQQASI